MKAVCNWNYNFLVFEVKMKQNKNVFQKLSFKRLLCTAQYAGASKIFFPSTFPQF